MQDQLAAASTQPWTPPSGPRRSQCAQARSGARHELRGAEGGHTCPVCSPWPWPDSRGRCSRAATAAGRCPARRHWTRPASPRRAGPAPGCCARAARCRVSHRPLLAHGDWPVDEASAAGPLFLHGAVVGFWLRTRAGMRPIAVPAAPSTRRAVGACHRRRGPVDLLSSGLPGG